MKHIEGKFEGVKGLRIYYQGWIPESPKAVVLFVHGLAEHGGRYPPLVKELTTNGYAIYANDHRGHGKSEGERVYIDSIDQYVEDEKLFHDIIKEKHPVLPVFMLGISLGSAITFIFAKKYGELLRGIILAATGSKIKVNILVRLIAPLLSKLMPHKKMGDEIDVKLVISDPKAVKAYETDPLVYHGPVTIRYAYELYKSVRNVETLAAELDLPLLVQCGAADKLLQSMNISTEGIDELFTMDDKTIKFYDGLYHDIYNEIEEGRKIVLKDLTEWLNSHV